MLEYRKRGVGFSAEEVEVEMISRVCHAANHEYCRLLGDDSHEPWEATLPAIANSVRSGVVERLERPGEHPSVSHERWVEYKRADGWSWGPEKDLAAREHPNMAPFEELPVVEQRKDFLFCAIVDALNPYLEAVPTADFDEAVLDMAVDVSRDLPAHGGTIEFRDCWIDEPPTRDVVEALPHPPAAIETAES